MRDEPAIDDGEVLRTPLDRWGGQPGAVMPRHRDRRPYDPKRRHAQGRLAGAPPKAPVIFALSEDLGPAATGETWGQFPRGFFARVLPLLRATPAEVLHVCSGALGPEVGGIRVDVRPEVLPDVVADGRALPFRDASAGAVLIDPPYSAEYAAALYGCEYPRPSQLLREAARVVRPCGRIGFVHYLVPSPPPRCRIVGMWGLSVGVGYRMRALTIYEREQPGLPGVTGA